MLRFIYNLKLNFFPEIITFSKNYNQKFLKNNLYETYNTIRKKTVFFTRIINILHTPYKFASEIEKKGKTYEKLCKILEYF